MDYLVNLERQASTMLGEREAQGIIPDLTWLSDLNPALRYPEIHDAICKGSLFVNFIVEPFGFSDAFVLLPGCIFLTIAEPGQMYENFVAYSRELSGKMQALADPPVDHFASHSSHEYDQHRYGCLPGIGKTNGQFHAEYCVKLV
jgi:hypothetical protein